MKKSKIVILIVLCLIAIGWGFVIYKFSSMSSFDSNGDSTNIISVFLEKGLEFTNELGITHSHPNESKIEHATNLLNSPLRKVMHASVYFVLAFFIILIINVFTKNKKFLRSFIITVLLCFIFAMTDEYHQTLVNGRTGQFLDVLIDTTGAILGGLFYGTYFVAYKIGKRGVKNEKECVNN